MECPLVLYKLCRISRHRETLFLPSHTPLNCFRLSLPAAMGFLDSCWETFLQVTAYAQMLGMDNDQSPLHLPHHPHGGYGKEISNQVSFQVPGTDFTCNYTMAGYTPCNSASNRTCWLESTKNGGRNYDIATDCMCGTLNSWLG